jgi:hypothetical protein
MIVSDVSREEMEAALDQGAFTRMVINAMANLAQCVEVAMNTRNHGAIDEMESVIQDMFQQARKTLNDNKGIMQ